jgi:peptide/nickel transport system substrate-binding protein
MRRLYNLSLVVCGMVFLSATLGVESAQAEPARGEPQYGGTVNILTRLAALNALSFNQYDWPWKTNHDALFLEHLAKGDLDFGPRGAGENPFKSLSYIPDKHLTGELAESWLVEEDPLRLVFNIRQGVYWPAKEGVMERRELVAEDIVFNYTHMKASPRGIPTWWEFISEWKSEGKYTAVAYLNKWNANIGYRLLWAYFAAIAPPEVLKMNDGKGSDDWRLKTGTGPYKLTDVRPDDVQVYDRNDEYWDKEEINGVVYDLPYNDRVVYHIMGDESARIAAIRTCKVDILEAFRWQFAEQLQRSAPELIVQSYLGSPPFLALRNDVAPFDDVRVRRAMNLAINQQEILDTLLNGEGEVLDYPFSSRWPDYYTPIDKLPPEGRELYEYHPEKAKQLLAEAGYPDGFEFDIMFSTADPYHLDLMAMFEAYYQRIGIKVIAKALDYPTFRAKMREPDQAAGYLMNVDEGNPFQVLRARFLTGQTWNPAFHSDVYHDETYYKALEERDREKRDTMLRELNVRLISERIPVVWLPTPTMYEAWWPYVKNYWGEHSVGTQDPGPIYARIWIDQEQKKDMGCD